MSQDPVADFSLLKIIFKKRRFILILTILSILGAAIFTGPAFISPRYQSEAIIYPASTNSNRMLIERDARFGSDKEIDEQIQLLRSTVVRDSIIRKYKLYTHYQVDTKASDKRYRLNEIFDDRIKIERTRYNSISIKVIDVDPVMAANMANDIVTVGDFHKAKIIKDKLSEAFDALSKNMFDISLQVDLAAAFINKSKNRNVVSGSSFYRKTNIDQLKEQFDIKEMMQTARENDEVKYLEQLYLYESRVQQLATIQASYDQALIAMNNQIPSSFVVSPAEVADKKSFPVRWLITLITAITVCIGSVVIVVLLEKWKEVKQTFN